MAQTPQQQQKQPVPDQPGDPTPGANSSAAAVTAGSTSSPAQTINFSSSTPSRHEQPSPDTGTVQDSTDVPNLPPHKRDTITRVPVTPDFDSHAVTTPALNSYMHDGHAERNRPPTEDDPADAISPLDKLAGPVAGILGNSKAGADVLRDALQNSAKTFTRMAIRRESLTDIRKSSPDLALSGNVISATFNIPHSLDYQKGADWVSVECGVRMQDAQLLN